MHILGIVKLSSELQTPGVIIWNSGIRGRVAREEIAQLLTFFKGKLIGAYVIGISFNYSYMCMSVGMCTYLYFACGIQKRALAACLELELQAAVNRSLRWVLGVNVVLCKST